MENSPASAPPGAKKINTDEAAISVRNDQEKHVSNYLPEPLELLNTKTLSSPSPSSSSSSSSSSSDRIAHAYKATITYLLEEVAKTDSPDRKIFEQCLSRVTELATEWANTDPKPNTILRKLSLNDNKQNLRKYTWNQVKLGEKIGKGVESEVYTAVWEEEEVAVKVLHSRTKGEEADRLWKDFVPHPNVARLRGLVQPDENYPHRGLIMDYHPPGALQDLDYHLPPEKCVEVFRGIAQGLSHLHRQNILHQDLARRNILLESTGGVVLTDFGLSVRLEDSNFSRTMTTKEGERLSLEMLAPEVCKALLEKKKIRTSERRDMWAFGVAMWEIVTNKPYIPPDMHPKTNGAEQLYRAILNDSLLSVREVVLKVGLAEPRIVVALVGCKQPKETRLTAEETRLVLGGAPREPQDDDYVETSRFRVSFM